MTRLLTVLAVLGLLVAACGDDDDTTAEDTTTTVADDDSTGEAGEDAPPTGDDDDTPVDADEDDYVSAMAAGLNEDGSFPGTDEDMECLAQGFIDAVGGADALREAGITPAEVQDSDGPTGLGLDLDEEQLADDLAAAFGGCGLDLIALLSDSLGATAPAGFEDCLREQLDNDDLARVFAATMIDPEDEAALDEILPILQQCAPTTTAG